MRILLLVIWLLTPLALSQVTVQPEKNHLRIRMEGGAALRICKFLGHDLKKQKPGFIAAVGDEKSGHSASCLVSGDSKHPMYLYGYLLDTRGKTLHLEHQGYQ